MGYVELIVVAVDSLALRCLRLPERSVTMRRIDGAVLAPKPLELYYRDNPIVEAVDCRDRGDFDGAFRLLQECIEGDLRCIDAYVHLGNFRSGDMRSEWGVGDAVQSYKAAVAVADRIVPPVFDGLLPWGWIDNRPLHRALHGLGLCQWRPGDIAPAGETFRRLASLDPQDPFDARYLLSRMESGIAYLQFREEEER